MAKRLLVATRKGLFDLYQQSSGDWQVTNHSFLGEPVSMVLRDPYDNTLYAALNLGHFDSKLHRSSDEGQQWEEISVPSYSTIKPTIKDRDDTDTKGPSLKQIWSMECGAPGTLWAGTIPGGLFKSTDRGDSWQLAENLWHTPLREQCFPPVYALRFV